MKAGFLREMLSGSEGTSSKRFNGTIGYLIVNALIVFVVIIDMLKDGLLQEGVKYLLNADIIAACGLLGVAAVEKLWVKPPEEKRNEPVG